MRLINEEHKGHNILGKYCWDCKLTTTPSIPGWPKAHKGDFIRYSIWEKKDGVGYCEEVVWANGDVERKRDTCPCSLCDKHCKYPVARAVTEKGDNYREVMKVTLS